MGSPSGPIARGRSRRLDLHQRHEPVDLRLGRGELRQHPTEAERLVAQAGPHPVVARGRRVALVEDEIDHLEDRCEPDGKGVRARDLERHVGLGQRSLRANDPLGDGRLGDEEGAGDLVGRQPAEEPERQGDPRLARQDRMAGREHEAEQVVAHVVVPGRLEGGHRHRLLDREVTSELLVLSVEHRPPSEEVDGPMLGRGHQPRAWVARDPGLRPLLERRDQRVLGELLGDPHVTDDPRKPGDEPGGFDAPDRLDGLVGLGRHQGGPSSISWISISARSPVARDRSSGQRRAQATASASAAHLQDPEAADSEPGRAGRAVEDDRIAVAEADARRRPARVQGLGREDDPGGPEVVLVCPDRLAERPGRPSVG